MALTGHPFPYDINNLLGGRVRVLFAPLATAVPLNIDDVIEVNSTGYAAQTGWTDLGAAKDSFSYSRGFDTSGWEIQQTTGNVVEEITDLTRTITVSLAEIKPEHLQLIENAPAVETVAAASGRSAQKRVKFGAFTSITRYRFAFLSQRSTASGIVTHSDTTTTRGRFVMGTAYEAQISADEVEFEQAKGELSAASVTFTLFPASGQPTGQEWGSWLLEDAGAIPA
jgi:hypothetical protein